MKSGKYTVGLATIVENIKDKKKATEYQESGAKLIYRILRQAERKNGLDSYYSDTYKENYWGKCVPQDFFGEILALFVEGGYSTGIKVKTGSNKGGKTTGDKARGKKREIPAKVQKLFDDFAKSEPRILAEWVADSKRTAFKEHFNKLLANTYPEYKNQKTGLAKKKGQRLTNRLLENYKTH